MRIHRSHRLAAALVALLLLAAPLTGCGAANKIEQWSGGGAGQAPSVGGGMPADKSGPAATDSYGGATDQGGQRSMASPEAAASPAAAVPLADRMVIRNGNVRLRVDKPLEGVETLRAMTKKYGGVVANLTLATEDGGQPIPYGGPERAVQSGMPFTASMTLLIPVAKFDAFRAEAVKLGRVLSESSADEDVTQQHVDLKARLANAKAEEVRLRSFFDRAKSVNDMLNVERELARVRGDIESMTAQLQTLERQAAMATLTIELIEPERIVEPSSGIDWGFREALRTGIQGMVGILKAIVVLVIASAPLWISLVIAFFLIRWRMRVKRSRAEGPAEAETDTAG